MHFVSRLFLDNIRAITFHIEFAFRQHVLTADLKSAVNVLVPQKVDSHKDQYLKKYWFGEIKMASNHWLSVYVEYYYSHNFVWKLESVKCNPNATVVGSGDNFSIGWHRISYMSYLASLPSPNGFGYHTTSRWTPVWYILPIISHCLQNIFCYTNLGNNTFNETNCVYYQRV